MSEPTASPGMLAPDRAIPRRFPQVAWTCASSSSVLLIVYVTFGLHLRLGLGHWPMPMVEDYDSPIFRLHEWLLIGCLTFAYLIAAPLYLLCLAIPALRPAPLRVVLLQLAIWLLGWLLFIGLYHFDPTPFSAWFAD
jgi:membrane-bound acyltransferase YfiQ involved in biofilm formation